MSAPGSDNYVEPGNTQSEYVSTPGAPESIMRNAPMVQSNELHSLSDTTLNSSKGNQSSENLEYNSPVNNLSNSNRHNFEIDYEVNKKMQENRKSQGISRNISELFMGLDFIRTQLFHDPFFTKKRVYSGVLFVGFIIAIIVLIAVIIICVVGHKNNYKYNTNKYGMQRTYTQYVLWQPIGSTNNNDNKFFSGNESKWQIVTFPEPNAGDCIIAYSAVCQGNTLQGTNTGVTTTSTYTFSLPFVSNCSAVSPNSCVVTVSSASNNVSANCPYGLYVTATYTPLKAFNGNGTQYANNLDLNETYKTYQYKLIKDSTNSSIAFFAPSNYTPPKS